MSSTSRSVAVLVSAGRHPVSGAPRACNNDAIAMALGRKLAGDALRIFHAGDPADAALQDYLAYGATRIDVVQLRGGADPLAALAGHLRSTEIILTGSRTERGAGSGLLPYVLAERLERPIVTDVLDIEIDNSQALLRQFLPKGKRRQIAAPVPLVVAVHPMAPASLSYAHARRMAGRIESIAATELQDTTSAPAWTVEPAARRPVQLKAQEQRDGHARMVSYVETQARGGAVVLEGSAVDKAQIILSYLRNNQLVDF